MSTLGVALLFALSSPTAIDVAVALGDVEAVGLSPAEAARLPGRIQQELALVGVRVAHSGAGAPEATLHVSLLRVGPLVEVAVRLEGRAGVVLVEERRTVQVGALGGATLLTPEVAEALRALDDELGPPAVEVVQVPFADEAPPRASPGSGEVPKASSGHNAAGGLTESLPATAVAPAPDEEPIEEHGGDEGGGWLGWTLAGAGGTVALAGLGVSALGLLGAAYEATVLQDPASLGDDKARARFTGPLALAMGAVGGAVVMGGALVASTSLAVE